MSTDYTKRIVNYALKESGFYPLRPVQLWFVDTHFNKANSTMMNIGALVKLHPDIDVERLEKVVNDLINHYDIFRCRFVFHEGTSDLCQRFDGEIIPVKIEKISDEEFEKEQSKLKKPYKIIGNPLYRIRIFQTPSANYFYFDFYHAIMDGMAIAVLFFRELNQRYKGKKITREPLNYADFILDEMRVSPEELAEGNSYWRNMLSDFDINRHLPPSDISKNEAWTDDIYFENLKNVESEYFDNAARKEDVFFLAAVMLALAKSSGEKKSILSRIYNGRMNAQERRLMGIMIEQYPIAWDFEKNITVENFLDNLEAKIKEGMKYRRSLGTVYSEGLEDDCATFIFQKGNLSQHDGVVYIDDKPLQIIATPPNNFNAAENTLDIEISSGTGHDEFYLLTLDYDASRYSRDAMEKFAELIDEMVLALQDEKKYIHEILKA